MSNSSLKLLAKRARGRLRMAAKTKPEPNMACLSAPGSYMLVASIRNIEDDPLYAKVKKIAERNKNEIIINPIAQLMDSAACSNMTPQARERYVLKLTKRYNEIYNYIMSEKLIEY